MIVLSLAFYLWDPTETRIRSIKGLFVLVTILRAFEDP
jgi:hypothetical protein